ncbi:MAG: CPBP family intramembrane metalloprotease [Gemmatimonadales bacterium]|nr:MAG: CPBP family intramembrane metalloprotease [Gemmatimonadales bacterium]
MQRSGPTPAEGILVVIGVLILYIVIGVTMHLLIGEAGILITQVLVLLVPALLFVRLRGYSFTRTFSLRRPTRRGLLGATLLMLGGLPIAWVFTWLQSFVLPVPVEMLEGLTEFLLTDDPLRIAWLVLLVAVTPAICEEFLFRGVLLSSFRGGWKTPTAIIASGLIFGAFHLSPETAFRFVPTAWLGILLAWIVVETRSIWTAVLLHFLNNGLILMLTLLPATREMASDVDQDPPWLLIPVAILIFVAGIRVLRQEGRRLREESDAEVGDPHPTDPESEAFT